MRKKWRKRFKLRKTLTEVFLKILKEKGHIYKLEEGLEDDEYNYIHVNISGMEYRRCVEDALCIEQQGDSPIPVLPYRILNSPERTKKILKKNGRNGYHVLRKDLARVMVRIWGVPKDEIKNYIN